MNNINGKGTQSFKWDSGLCDNSNMNNKNISMEKKYGK